MPSFVTCSRGGGGDCVLRAFSRGARRVLILPVADRAGVLQGTTWGDMGGWPAFTRIRIGEHTTQADLNDDWMMTHELVHTAFPSLPDDEHWMEEGLATYIEPLARVMIGDLTGATACGTT